jgi:flagellar motor switch protein FliG
VALELKELQERAAPGEPRAPSRLSGREKAAILLVTLGQEFAAQVFRHLREEEIEQITLQIAAVRKVEPAEQAAVLDECRQMMLANQFIEQGGVEYAREVLEKALGTARAADVLARLTSTLLVRPFEFARRSDPAQLLTLIQGEHPQTIALVLAHLHPEQASAVLAALEPERQIDVIRRLALMDATSPEVVKEVERVLERKATSLLQAGQSRAGGVEMAVQVLSRVDRSTEKRILVALEAEDPELAQEMRRRMFVFEDIVHLDDRSLQRALRDIDLSHDMPLALKVASPEVKAKILRNVSKRQAEMLMEAIELLGPVRLREVEDAQQRVVAVIRRLEDEGEVVIARGGEDQMVV